MWEVEIGGLRSDGTKESQKTRLSQYSKKKKIKKKLRGTRL
jgi:hypothetical protein